MFYQAHRLNLFLTAVKIFILYIPLVRVDFEWYKIHHSSGFGAIVKVTDKPDSLMRLTISP